MGKSVAIYGAELIASEFFTPEREYEKPRARVRFRSPDGKEINATTQRYSDCGFKVFEWRKLKIADVYMHYTPIFKKAIVDYIVFREG